MKNEIYGLKVLRPSWVTRFKKSGYTIRSWRLYNLKKYRRNYGFFVEFIRFIGVQDIVLDLIPDWIKYKKTRREKSVTRQ